MTRPANHHWKALCAGLVAFVWIACGEAAPESGPVPERPPDVGAPNARHGLAAHIARDREAVRDPSDGAGQVSLVHVTPQPLRAGGVGRFEFVFEAGPLGVARGGSLFFQPPIWGWTDPGETRPGTPGVTTLFPVEADLGLRRHALDAGLVQFEVSGRAMRPGERVVLRYGSDAMPVRVGARAERRARFQFWVDGNGDGVRGLMSDPPAVDVLAGPPAQLVAHLPATLRPGQPGLLRIAVLDALGSSGTTFEGTVTLDLPKGVDGPDEVVIGESDGGVVAVEMIPQSEGILEVGVHAGADFEARTPPSLVSADAPLLLWLDLHGHTQLSDGTGTPADYFRYARDVGALDGAALTDHDHWGVPFLDETPANWNEIRSAVQDAHDPGRFLAFLGFEWTSWVWGHRHVVYFEDDGPLFSWAAPETDTPGELWDALRGRPVVTFAHHSAGDPVATDWRVPPDPELEPITEIASVHGSSEAAETPAPVRGGIAGNHVRDALDRGYSLGFIGSGDSHDGHPGLVHLGARSGGLAGVYAAERSRGAVLSALRARRVYATNGPRILLSVSLGGLPMGSEVPETARRLKVQVAAPDELEAIELVADGAVVERLEVEGRSASYEWTLPAGAPERWLYVRVLQRDGGAAWSSPFFPSSRVNP